MKTKRIALLLIVLALVVSFCAPISVAETTQITAKSSSLSSYYKKNIKPQMDNIGTEMRKQLSTKTEMQNAFKKAHDAVVKLEKAVNKKSKLKNDKKLKSYLKNLKSNINKGQKRAKKVASSDSKLMKYQKNAAKYLKKFKSRIKKLI